MKAPTQKSCTKGWILFALVFTLSCSSPKKPLEPAPLATEDAPTLGTDDLLDEEAFSVAVTSTPSPTPAPTGSVNLNGQWVRDGNRGPLTLDIVDNGLSFTGVDAFDNSAPRNFSATRTSPVFAAGEWRRTNTNNCTTTIQIQVTILDLNHFFLYKGNSSGGCEASTFVGIAETYTRQ